MKHLKLLKRVNATASLLLMCVGTWMLLSNVAYGTMWYGERGNLGTPASVAEKAEIVFRGIVTSVENRYVINSLNESIPYSVIKLSVTTAYRGTSSGSTIEIYIAGGITERGGKFQISGQPKLKEGEDVILFLNPRDYPLFATVGGSAGVMRVAKAGSKEIILNNSWRPLLTYTKARRKAQTGIHCWTEKEDRRMCGGWYRPEGTLSDDDGGATALALDIDDFESELSLILEDGPSPTNTMITREEFLVEYGKFAEP